MDEKMNSDTELPEKWIKVFSLIDKAGGVKMPNIKDLTPSERIKARLNFWAFFFGPIYYLIKNMWKKAITYFGLIILFIVAFDYIAITYFHKDDINIPGVAVGIIWAMLANVDYYKVKVLGEDKWI